MDEDEYITAEIIEADINDLCRICGSSSESPLIPIYEENGLSEDLASKIMLYLPIKVAEEDILPVKVCVMCTNSILTWHLLYECCVDADRRFRSMVSLSVEKQLVHEEQHLIEGTELPAELELQKEKENIHNDDDHTQEIVSKEAEDALDPVKESSDREMDDIMFLKAEFGPEDEEYFEEEMIPNNDENGSENGDSKPVKHRIFKSRQQHQCNFCGTNFTTKELLTEHLKNKHYNLIFHCDLCNEYKDQKDLISHMTSHALSSAQQPQSEASKPKNQIEGSANNNNKLKCKKCEKNFNSLSALRYHMNSVHAKLKNFKCTKCEKTFSCKRVLDNHIKSIHTKKKLLQCDLCEKSFKTDSALYSHKKTHSNVFPYECSQCGKTFRFKHHHVAHLEIHSMVKKYTCKICNKQFYAQSNLSKHIKTHSTSLDFTCHICGFKMTQKRYLYEHMKQVHKRVLNKSTN